MELLNKIKQDRMTFYKLGNRDNYETLGIIVGDVETLSKKKDVTDSDILQIIKKYKKSLEETMKLKPSDKLTKELALVDQYLPTTVSEEHLSRVINDLISTSVNTMPLLMKSLKETFGNQLDGKMASSLIKSKI